MSSRSNSVCFNQEVDIYDDTNIQAEIDSLKLTIEQLQTKLSSVEENYENFTYDHENEHVASNINSYLDSENLGQTGFKYRQYFFRNPAHTKQWMKTNMTHPCHGLFVDLVSFSEFFGTEK